MCNRPAIILSRVPDDGMLPKFFSMVAVFPDGDVLMVDTGTRRGLVLVLDDCLTDSGQREHEAHPIREDNTWLLDAVSAQHPKHY